MTASGDAGGGGGTWVFTCLDVLRTLNEAGGFASITNGLIFHNTLAISDYEILPTEQGKEGKIQEEIVAIKAKTIS